MTPDLRNIAFRGFLLSAMVAPGHSFADVVDPAPAAPKHTLTLKRPTAARHADDPADPKSGDPAPVAPAPPAAEGEEAPLTPDQMGQAYQKLSPEAHAALQELVKSKGVDGLSSMSESDARTTFNGLPANVKDQIQAKWDAMSDEQRIALKKMGPDAIKKMFASQMKGMLHAQMDPMMKPVTKAVETTAEVAQKAKDVLKKSREFVQKWLTAFRGPQPENQASQ